MKPSFLFNILVAFIFIFNNSFAQINEQDSAALVAFFNATDGPNWSNNENWLTGSVETWHGVIVTNDRVTQLTLSGNYGNPFGLTGTLPVEIGNLTALRSLNLAHNNLSGAIPASIGNLINLETLSLDQNQLEGSIPEQLGNLTNLFHLSLAHNNLSGQVPTELKNLTNLFELFLEYNNLSGPIPIELCTELGNLFFLYINNNDFGEGDCEFIKCLLGRDNNDSLVYEPQNNLNSFNDICDFSDIYSVSVSDSLALVALYNSTNGQNWNNNENWLTGLVGTWYGVTVSSNRVLSIELAQNNLDGYLPPEIGNLTELEILDLSGNQMGGNLPTEIGECKKLVSLLLNDNKFNGNLPESFYELTDLALLFLQQNLFTGEISDNISNLTKLKGLRIGNNEFKGAVPNSLNELTKITEIRMEYNNFMQMPILDKINYLFILKINNNKLSFDDIEKNIPYAIRYEYQNQDEVGEEVTKKVKEGETFIYELLTGGTANQYQWFKGNTVVTQKTADNRLIIENFSPANEGDYKCYVTNTIATQLTLVSAPIHLQISPTGKVKGNVTVSGGTVVGNGKVYAYLDENIGQFALADSSPIIDGNYEFDKLVFGNYLFLAKADTSIYKNAQPTYYTSSLSWNNADTIVLSSDSILNTDIVVREIEPVQSKTSKSTITGTVAITDNSIGETEPSGLTVILIEQNSEGAKSSSFRAIYIEKEKTGEKINGEVIAITSTDENGSYSFSNVNQGNYIVLIDIPGVENYTQHQVQITSNEDSIMSVDYTISDDKVIASGIVSDISTKSNINDIKLYPNPTSGVVNIKFQPGQFDQILVFNSYGQLIQKLEIDPFASEVILNLDKVNTGIYFCSLIGKHHVTKKIVVEK